MMMLERAEIEREWGNIDDSVSDRERGAVRMNEGKMMGREALGPLRLGGGILMILLEIEREEIIVMMMI